MGDVDVKINLLYETEITTDGVVRIETKRSIGRDIADLEHNQTMQYLAVDVLTHLNKGLDLAINQVEGHFNEVEGHIDNLKEIHTLNGGTDQIISIHAPADGGFTKVIALTTILDKGWSYFYLEFFYKDEEGEIAYYKERKLIKLQTSYDILNKGIESMLPDKFKESFADELSNAVENLEKNILFYGKKRDRYHNYTKGRK